MCDTAIVAVAILTVALDIALVLHAMSSPPVAAYMDPPGAAEYDEVQRLLERAHSD